MRVVATAGHIDHGKSSLVQALTGTNPDRFEEERIRGLTIDLGFAHTTLPSGDGISFVDVPGHVRFLRNMLAGVGGVDACMFVVAATEGWKPQSEEHLRILELVGLGHGIVALTKIDLVDDEWRQMQSLDIRSRLSGSMLADAPIVPVSMATGEGLDDVRAALDVLVHQTPAALDRGRPRLWVDRVFAAKGSGTVVTGTLTGGSLRADQQVQAAGHAVRIRAIQSLGQSRQSIAPGNRVALNLVGIDHTDLKRGDAVILPEQWRSTRRFDASLQVLPALHHEVSRRGAYFAYIGSGQFPVKVRVLGSEAIPPGGTGLVRLHVGQPLPLTPGDRFVLRESGRDETVGGGEVLDVAPVLPASKARPDRSVERVIAERGWVAADDLEALTGERREPTLGHGVVSAEWLEATQRHVRARIEAAGALGLDIAELNDRQRAVVNHLDGVAVEAGRARPAGTRDPLDDHPFVAALLAGGVTPPEPSGVDKVQLRELLRRKLVVERDGVYFHPATIDNVAVAAARLLGAHPDGFTVAQLRDDLGVSRKYALPLGSELDARGITRRRGDLRVAGPR
ncbi:MAG: selenocysteine-specific translation elongation factor, partial [Actinomycetota bacterium]|nr:selenocysteine-specific translation elongation factor [Actinomycetota bacterium]